MGISATNQSRKGGSSLLPTAAVVVRSNRLRLASGSMFSIAIRGGATKNVNRLETTIMVTNSAIALPPSWAIVPVVSCPAMAVIISAINSGTTVMRIPFTHSVPIGSIIDGRSESAEISRSEKLTPPIRPIPSPIRMRVEALINSSTLSWGSFWVIFLTAFRTVECAISHIGIAQHSTGPWGNQFDRKAT